MTPEPTRRIGLGDIRRRGRQTIDTRRGVIDLRGELPPRAPVYAPVPRELPRRRHVVAPAPVPKPTLQPVSPASSAQTRTTGRWRYLSWLQYPLIALAALAAAFNSTAGQIMVALFGLYVLIRRRSARLSFGAALFVLLTIPLFQVLGRGGIAENAAIYVYELLVIGTVSAVIELRKSGDTDE